MPTCPLCESSQALGDTCDVCGRPFPAGEASPVRIPRLAELEPTLLDAAPDVLVTRLPELEPTGEASAPAPDVALVEGFDPTSAPPVTVQVEPLEVERSDQEPEPEPGEPGPVRCRYCLTPATPGQRLCVRCGMRLPLDRSVSRPGAAEARPCSDCGVPVTGSQCPACGARR